MSYNLDPKKMSDEDWMLSNCKEYSLYLTSNSQKTEKQMRDKLKMCKKNYTDKVIDEVITFLKKYDYINDENFVKRYIEIFNNKKSFKEMKFNLYKKGISKNLIDKYFNDTYDNDEKKLAIELLEKKIKKIGIENIINNNKEKQKLYAYLYRKGINPDDISSAMESILSKNYD